MGLNFFFFFAHQVLLVHAVDVRPYYGEVLHPLRRGRVRDVDGHLDVVPDVARLALEGTRQLTFRQLELERKLMQTSREDRNVAFYLVWKQTRLTCVDMC